MRLPVRDAAPLLAALLVLAVLGGALFALVPVRTGLAEFLPPGRTRATEFLVNELRSGAASSLLLAGIEGAPPEELARLSRATGAALRASGHFAFVGDGTTTLGEAEQALLFRHRYLLSPHTRPEAFEAPALRAKLEALLDGLRSAASPLLARFGFADPTGAFLGLAQGLLSESRIEARDGAWFAPGADPPTRALLLARTRGSGLDSEAQAEAVAAFRAAFQAAGPGEGARLLLSGPGVFAAEAAAAIRADVRMMTVLSVALLAAFLLWRTRSLLPLLAATVPLGAGMLAGVSAVALFFGGVHAIALGFGSTMLGVAVDYPILLTALRRPGEGLPTAAARTWPTLRLAATAAVAGLAAMVGSGFPGLVQLGLFAGAGLVAAALATRWLLPRLLPRAPAEPRPLPAPLARPLLALAGHRRGALGVVAAAGLLLAALGGPRWQRDLAALSPVPAAAQALDAELRRQLGAPDVRFLVAIGPGDEAAVLRTAERLRRAVAPLIARGALTGLDEPSRYLPSLDTQHARQAALPDAAALEARLGEAMAGLPFRPGAFSPFLAAVEESRAMQPLGAEALAEGAPTVAARLSPLLSWRDDGWRGLAVATGVADPAALAEAVASLGDPSVLFLDTKAETEGLLDAYARSTALWALGGGALVLGLLAAGLGGLRPALLAAAPIAGAVVVTLAVLAALGQALNLFHLASLLLLAGVAIDYSLFLGRSPGADAEEARRSLGAVLNCAVCTLLTFGLLAFCKTPVLHGIGLTVSVGVAAAFLLSCALAAPPAHAR
ncbi:MMPL family transporter [Craurococcus roseus]|uniref:MMPL family transporter n=1 Tax=Craurococcus roseus TaxID=77585 RepID=A0ABN1EPV5_9PROT